MPEPRFIDVDECLRIHARMLARFGGADGVRSRGLLESAVAAPRAGMFGEYFHRSIPAMAAALAFSLVSNHPFVDGNKRVGLVASTVFLKRNGFRLAAGNDEAADLFLRLAAGEVDKDALVAWHEAHARQAPA